MAFRTLAEYDRHLKRFETHSDSFILPDLRLIVRVDGRRFGDLISDIPDLKRPFDERVRDGMLACTRDLLQIGYKVVFAVVQSDEISLLLDAAENSGTRRRSKLLSLFASEATLSFQRAMGVGRPFHSRLSELPSIDHVIDYFMWRRALVKRNCITDLVTHLLLQQGLSQEDAALKLQPLDEEGRRALLVELGSPYSDLPAWQRLGSAVWWADSTTICYTVEPDESESDYEKFLREKTTGQSYLSSDGLPGFEVWNRSSDAAAQSAQPFRISTPGAVFKTRS